MYCIYNHAQNLWNEIVHLQKVTLMHSWLYTNFRGVWKSNGIICTGFIRVCIFQIFQICLTGCKTGCKARQFRTIQLYNMSFLFSFILYIIHFCSLSLSCSATICSVLYSVQNFFTKNNIVLVYVRVYYWQFFTFSLSNNETTSLQSIKHRLICRRACMHGVSIGRQNLVACGEKTNAYTRCLPRRRDQTSHTLMTNVYNYGLCRRILAISYLDHIVHYVSTIYTVNVYSTCTCLICSFEEQFFCLSILLPLFLVHKSQHQT